MARETLFAHIAVPDANVFRMDGERCGDAAAADYAQRLAQALPAAGAPGHWPCLDLVLLGMGGDGHTASLFPGMPSLDEAQRAVVWTRVPENVRPAVPRLTLTLPVLNAARHLLFLVAGAEKAHAVRSVLDQGPQPATPLPAERVRPANG